MRPPLGIRTGPCDLDSRDRHAGRLGNLVEVTTRQTYAEASRALLRTTLLDGLRDLLGEKDWPSITMADVARKSGVGRQTVYNEFGSRHGLAQAYAMRLAKEFAGIVASTVAERPHDIHGALHDAFAAFFAEAAADPLITSLQRGEAKPDLLRLITTDAAPLITTASARLTDMLTTSWLGLADDDAVCIARAITRMALSYVAMPPESDRDVAADLAAVMAPAVIAARGGETESGATPTAEE